MLSLGVRLLPPPPAQCSDIPESPVSQFITYRTELYQTRLSFCSNRVTHLGFCAVLGQIRNVSCGFAIRSPRKGSNSLLEMEMDNSDDDFEEEEEDDYEEEEEEDEDEDDDDEIVVPIRDMRKWLENKPRGFGEGKEYDTSIEDKLAEEMEQSRLAQLANINKLKNNPQGTNSKKEQLQNHKVSEVVSSGICVRLINLPKKKNIHRDLRQAFKGVQGIVSIVPVVSGNKKTREPIGKGIAFVYFKSEDEANRFVQIFSTQSIAFGKIQKQIKYEIVDSSSPKPAHEKSVDNVFAPTHVAESNLEIDLVDNPFFNSREENVPGEYDSADDEHVSAVQEDTGEKIERFSSLEHSGDDSSRQKPESATKSLSSKQQEKTRAKRKKVVVKKKVEKVPRLNILGSANRLKIKEKAVLTDVYSKYGAKANLAAKEHHG